jgi:DNA-binding response OmpR family regulator
MPGVGGNALAKSLQVRWPDIPVLFTSGYTGDDAVQRGLLDEGTEFMQKPLEPEMVAMRVRQILDTRTNGVPH